MWWNAFSNIHSDNMCINVQCIISGLLLIFHLGNIGFHIAPHSCPPIISWGVNTLRPSRNKQHFADNIFRRIFFNKNVCISIEISLRFVPKGQINNIPALVQIMACCPSGDKTLSEPIMVSLLTHICVTRPQWVLKNRAIVKFRHVWHSGEWFLLHLFKFTQTHTCILLTALDI